MTTDVEMFAALSEPFPADAIHWRVGATTKDKDKGIGLAYIDARDVMDRLDEVVGCDAWQDTYAETNKGRILCALSLLINGEWITKSDGAGDTDVEGDKGGISDAFKRAAVKFGVGRYLYRLPNTWYPIKPAGRSYKLASTPGLPKWALPGGTPPTAKQAEPEAEPAPEEKGEEPRPEKPDKKYVFGRAVHYLELLEEMVGEEKAQSTKLDVLKHSDYSHGCLDLSAAFKRGTITECWRLKDEIKAVVQEVAKGPEEGEE